MYVYVLWSLKIIFGQQNYINKNIQEYKPEEIQEILDESIILNDEPSEIKLNVQDNKLKDYVFDSKQSKYVKVK